MSSTRVQIEMRPLSPSETRIIPSGTTTTTTTTTNRLADLASFDSSDTWASSNPFPSITDLPAGGGGGGSGGNYEIHQNNPESNPSPSNPSYPYGGEEEREEEEEEEENSTLLYQGHNEFNSSSTSTTTTAAAAAAGDQVRVLYVPNGPHTPRACLLEY